MKKIIVLLLAVSSLTACQKSKNTTPTTSFDIPYSQTQALSLQSGTGNNESITDAGQTLSFAPVTMATNIRQYLDKYHTNTQNVQSTYIGGMNLQIPTPGNHYFDFADKLELYISGNGQPEVLAAYNYNIPKGVKSINLILVSGINLKNYIVNDSITVRLSAHAVFMPMAGAQIASWGDFQVTATPVNQ